tara:strand:- start:14 stop:400 length:387 start_codon:yes stop_codon:yes gene_type:complete
MALRKDNDRMKGFVDKINKTEPKKSHGFIPPAITKKHIKQTLREHDKRSGKPHVPSKNLYPEKGNPAIEMVSNPAEWVIGGGAAKPAFNLFKNVTRRFVDKAARYAKSQLPKSAGEAGVDITQNYFRK